MQSLQHRKIRNVYPKEISYDHIPLLLILKSPNLLFLIHLRSLSDHNNFLANIREQGMLVPEGKNWKVIEQRV